MNRRSAKIAISLEPELLAALERIRRTTGENRSAVFARAVREFLHTEARSARVAEYEEAYTRLPESSADVDAARKLARASLAHLAWDE